MRSPRDWSGRCTSSWWRRRAEGRSARLPDRLDPVDHILRGWAWWYQHQSVAAARQARESFEAALRLDENNLDALLGVANVHMCEVNNYASDDREGQIRAAETAALASASIKHRFRPLY